MQTPHSRRPKLHVLKRFNPTQPTLALAPASAPAPAPTSFPLVPISLPNSPSTSPIPILTQHMPPSFLFPLPMNPPYVCYDTDQSEGWEDGSGYDANFFGGGPTGPV